MATRAGAPANRASVAGYLPDRPAITAYRCASPGFVKGGDHRAVHAGPAGLARLRDAINSRLGRVQLPDSAGRVRRRPPAHRGRRRDRAAGLRPRHGRAAATRWPAAARSDPAGPAGTSAAMPTSSRRARTVASDATPRPSRFVACVCLGRCGVTRGDCPSRPRSRRPRQRHPGRGRPISISDITTAAARRPDATGDAAARAGQRWRSARAA